MSNTLTSIIKIKELRERIFYTLSLLIVFRIGAQIPVPGVNISALKLFMQSNNSGNNPLMEYFNFFAGGAFDNLSL